MFLIYPLVCLFLSLTHWAFKKRAAKAEKHFYDAASLLDASLKDAAAAPKGGETYAMKFHRERGLVQISEKRDAAESKALAWERRCDRVGGLRAWMKTTLGKTCGYLCGCLDSVCGTASLVAYGLGVEPGTAFDWAWHTAKFWVTG